MRPLPALVGISLLAILTGCGLHSDEHPRALDRRSAPINLNSTARPVVSGASRALVYLSRSGVLVAVARAVPSQPSPAVVLQALLAGPSGREQDAGLTTAVPRATVVDSSLVGGEISVEVPAQEASSSGRTDEVLGFGQIVLTLTSLPDVAGVRFVRDGHDLPVPRSDGSLSSGPLTRRDYADLL
jgi:spore germination protein GerM